ncbi:guanine nucleotide binding protein- alpha subunit [Apiospora arundinis]|uniref:Uncharacterized protein n=1 Tax=Apiospora arundinis TaxID=335852 RepID=A0ABR2IRT0_9PEZI
MHVIEQQALAVYHDDWATEGHECLRDFERLVFRSPQPQISRNHFLLNNADDSFITSVYGSRFAASICPAMSCPRAAVASSFIAAVSVTFLGCRPLKRLLGEGTQSLLEESSQGLLGEGRRGLLESSQNRMMERLLLFDSVVNSRWFSAALGEIETSSLRRPARIE